MKRFAAPLVAVFLLISGCGTPTQKNDKAEKRVETAKQAIAKNKDQQVEEAKGYVYAADRALSLDPNPSRFSTVGKMMTERSLLTLGNPDFETVIQYQRIIDGLVSTNAALQRKAEAELAKKDNQVIELQGDKASLERKLGKAEDSRKELAEKYAGMASKWARLIFWIRFAIYGVIGVFIFRLIGVFVPPPYNSFFTIIDFIFGGIGRCLFKLLPKAKETAGVVAKEAYDISEKTLSAVVGAVQAARQNPDVRNHIDPLLKDATDKEVTRPKIIDVKTNLGHI